MKILYSYCNPSLNSDVVIYLLVLPFFSFELIFRLDLAGFIHSSANRKGRLWKFEIVSPCDHRLHSQESHKRVFFIDSFAPSFQSHLRCSYSFLMFSNEIKLQEHFSPSKVLCGDATLRLTLCHIYS